MCRDILDRQLNPNPAPKATPWGGVGGAKGAHASSMRDIMFEESAADLEGGNMDDDEPDMISGQPQARVRICRQYFV